jgi:hypothetical protein
VLAGSYVALVALSSVPLSLEASMI